MTLITKLRHRLRLQRCIIAVVISLAAAGSIGLLANFAFGLSELATGSIAMAVLFLLIVIYYRSGSFSLPPSEVIVRYLDRTYSSAEDSSGLFLKSDLNQLEKLQLDRIDHKLASSEEDVKLPQKQLVRSVLISVSMVAIAYLVTIFASHTAGLVEKGDGVTQQIAAESDNQTSGNVPVIQSVQIEVNPPDYTSLETTAMSSGTVTAAMMSVLSWEVDISGDMNDAVLIFNDRDRVQLKTDTDTGTFKGEVTAENRMIYRISVSSVDTTIYSDYYSIEVTGDQQPGFRVSSPEQMRTMLSESKRQTEMKVEVLDDYGIQEISLYTTLARGSGESVRFREKRMEFDRVSGVGSRLAEASIILNADSLGMTPGDELYIYATASDNHPNTQVGRSDTYMIVVEDTTRAQPLLAGNIVIDLMPEDFRSQRQIIVDTEELISEKNQISDEQFKVRSRRIGRDQEMLMLDFGQFMSMEEEAASDGSGMAVSDNNHDGHTHEGEGEGQGETELDGEGQETTQSTAASIIPEEFFHDHGSPEMNTLFAESPRALLRRALSEMFRASQYLQTDRPEEALAYEYRALEFLQEAQQADRRYVRRAGLDGIPIPEDEERLTGEIDDFANPEFSYRADLTLPPLILFERQIREEQIFSEDDLQQYIDEIQKADITESDKLFLLNRVTRLNSSNSTGAVKQQLIAKLNEINSDRQRNPSPARIPVLKTAGGNE